MIPDLIYFELVGISIVDIAVSIFIQRRIASAEKTYLLQKKMNDHLKDLKDLSAKKAPQEHINAKQKEIQQTMSETMMHQFRATPVLLVVSVLLYFLILPNLFPSTTINTIPLIGYQYHGFQDNYFFIGFTFVASMIVQLTLSSRDKKRFDAKYGVAPPAPPAPQEPPSQPPA